MHIKRYIGVIAASLAAGFSSQAQEWVTLSITNGAMCSVLEVPEGTAVELVTMKFWPHSPVWFDIPKVHFLRCDDSAPVMDAGDAIVGPVKLYLHGASGAAQVDRFGFATFKLHHFKKNASLVTEGSADLKSWSPIATNQVQIAGTNQFFRTRIDPAK